MANKDQETTSAKNEEMDGWARPHDSFLRHYFQKGRLTSLCGNFRATNNLRFTGDKGKQDCSFCKDKIKSELAEKLEFADRFSE